METFTPPRDLVAHPGFRADRDRALAQLDPDGIDPPIAGLIESFSLLPCAFTLQSCHGHFLHAAGQDEHNLDGLPSRPAGPIEYRIAYLAFCLENSLPGRVVYDSLASVTLLDPSCIQFGSADWFWERCPNTFVLQVGPHRCRTLDRFPVEYVEGLYIQGVRDRFFARLAELLRKHLAIGR